jgi:hypothetical protein
MFKSWIKTLPLINLWAENRQLKADLDISTSQNLLAIDCLSKQILNSGQLNLNKALTVDNCSKPITVSLTSYAQRVTNVHHTIISLLNQSRRPDRLVLWLAEDEYNRESLPTNLLQLEQYGVEIAYCQDIKSYKKLLPALEQYPDDILITFDDDVIYPLNQIARLVDAHVQHPTSIICHRAHRLVKNNKGKPLPYAEWELDATDPQQSYDLLPVGIGGVLYPPHCLHAEVFNQQAFMELCPTADDLWFKAMSLKAQTQIKLVDDPLPYEQYLQLPHAFYDSLWQQNKFNNDKQLKALLNAYPELTF